MQTARQPFRQHVFPHPPRAVGPVARNEAGAHLCAKLFIASAALTARPCQPGIEPTSRDTERLGQPTRRPDPRKAKSEHLHPTWIEGAKSLARPGGSATARGSAICLGPLGENAKLVVVSDPLLISAFCTSELGCTAKPAALLHERMATARAFESKQRFIQVERDRHGALRSMLGGSATGLSATDAWARAAVGDEESVSLIRTLGEGGGHKSEAQPMMAGLRPSSPG